MNKVVRYSIAALLAAGMAGSVGAAHSGRGERVEPSQHAFGKVIQVKPIYDTVRVGTPLRQCWKEYSYRGPVDTRDEAVAGAVIGGIVGGVAGNQLGYGDGRTLMTVAGSVLGAVVGHEIGANLAADDQTRHATRRCETVERAETREELVGYRVKYQYKGRIYSTQTDRHPGERIRVDNGLRPTHF